jgi:hypothetical protein
LLLQTHCSSCFKSRRLTCGHDSLGALVAAGFVCHIILVYLKFKCKVVSCFSTGDPILTMAHVKSLTLPTPYFISLFTIFPLCKHFWVFTDDRTFCLLLQCTCDPLGYMWPLILYSHSFVLSLRTILSNLDSRSLLSLKVS